MWPDDGNVGAGVDERVEHVAGDGRPLVGPLDDPVADVAAGEEATGVVVVPHPVLQNPGVRTADGDGVGPLAVLEAVEPGPGRRGVVGVTLQQFDERSVHTGHRDARTQISLDLGRR